MSKLLIKSIASPLALFLSSQLFAEAALLGTREVLLDNEKVEMVRLTYPPGTESGVHNHPYDHRALYVIEPGKLQLIPVAKSEPSRILDLEKGMALFLPGTTHNVRNIGESTIILLETEIK